MKPKSDSLSATQQQGNLSDPPKHAPGTAPDKHRRLLIWFLMVILIVILMCLKK